MLYQDWWTRWDWPSDVFLKLTNVMRGCARLCWFPYFTVVISDNTQMFCRSFLNIEAYELCRTDRMFVNLKLRGRVKDWCFSPP